MTSEFRIACETRFVDCEGWNSFQRHEGDLRNLYCADPTLPDDIPFDSAWDVLKRVGEAFAAGGVFPLVFPLPKL